MRTLWFLILIVVFATPALAQDRRYEAGQVWNYRTDARDAGSLIKIQLVEETEDPSQPIYHISMIGIRVDGLPEAINIEHLPVSQETLDTSVTQLADPATPFPDYRGGYDIWRADNGGVFTITLVQIADIIRQSLSAQLRQ